MAIEVTHDLHRRRFSRNVGVGVVLLLFVVLVFALTIVKVQRGDPMEGYDHTVRPELLPEAEAGQ
jgi:ABC-type transporter Mla subunit MlaD